MDVCDFGVLGEEFGDIVGIEGVFCVVFYLVSYIFVLVMGIEIDCEGE